MKKAKEEYKKYQELTLSPVEQAYMDTIKDAVEEAFSLAGEQDVIIAFGSLSFIGEMTDIVENL